MAATSISNTHTDSAAAKGASETSSKQRLKLPDAGRQIHWLLRLGLAALSGLLMAGAFDPIGIPPLAFVALVPLFIALASGGWFVAFLGGMITGGIWYGISLSWVSHLSNSGFGAMLLWLMLLLGIFAILARVLIRRGAWWSIFGVPCLWAVFEAARLTPVPVPFPWLWFGYSQYRFVQLIQIADIAGALGVSFLLVLVNVWLVGPVARFMRHPATCCGFRMRQFWLSPMLTALLIAAVYGYGVVRIDRVEQRYTYKQGPKIGLVQPNNPSWAPLAVAENRRRHIAMSAEIMRETPDVDILVWSETMLWFTPTIGVRGLLSPDQAGGPAIGEGYALEDARRSVAAAVLSDRAASGTTNPDGDDGSPPPALTRFPYMVVGALTFTLEENLAITVPDASGEPRHPTYRRNRVYLVRPADPNTPSMSDAPVSDIAVDWYDKQGLVPAGEYVPFARELPFMVEAVAAGHDRGQVPNIKPGSRHTQFLWPAPSAAGTIPEAERLKQTRFAVPICYDIAWPDVCRRLAVGEGEVAPAPIDFFITVSNDGWYRRSAELDQMLAMSVFRCVENRAGMARCTNTGISAFIAPSGRVTSVLMGERPSDTGDGTVVDVKEVQGTLVGRVQIASGLYVPYRDTIGEGFAVACGAMFLLLFIVALAKPGRQAVLDRPPEVHKRHRGFTLPGLRRFTGEPLSPEEQDGINVRGETTYRSPRGKSSSTDAAAQTATQARDAAASDRDKADGKKTTTKRRRRNTHRIDPAEQAANRPASRPPKKPPSQELDDTNTGGPGDPMRSSQGIVHKPPPSSADF